MKAESLCPSCCFFFLLLLFSYVLVVSVSSKVSRPSISITAPLHADLSCTILNITKTVGKRVHRCTKAIKQSILKSPSEAHESQLKFNSLHVLRAYISFIPVVSSHKTRPSVNLSFRCRLQTREYHHRHCWQERKRQLQWPVEISSP